MERGAMCSYDTLVLITLFPMLRARRDKIATLVLLVLDARSQNHSVGPINTWLSRSLRIYSCSLVSA